MQSVPARLLAIGVLVAAAVGLTRAQSGDGFKFKSGVELINVTATVTDSSGRFAPGLQKEDFKIYEDGVAQEITHFSSERVPVSLGILLDTSGSMTEEKMSRARSAIDRLINDLLGPEDELFFETFAQFPDIVETWTNDRSRISRAVQRVRGSGGTALYDAISEALPLAEEGRNRKKAILVISDGNDTNSRISPGELRQQIRATEVLVYALGVDGTETSQTRIAPPRSPFPPPVQLPFPFPGAGGGRRPFPRPPIRPQVIIGGGGGNGGWSRNPGERVNAGALRDITDDTGGRTEIVRGFGDLDGATARIADELSRQYYLGYSSTGKKDGRWHTIRVDVNDKQLTVRARKGFVAS